ncbi:Uncharacterised protein [Mycobacteroides abscessus subsp. abscessus]|nr:Uncharacterised protein [Mycobacteroides abscessus subsp. abscessus]
MRSLANSASLSRSSSSRSALGVWNIATLRERFWGRRTSWNQVSSPFVAYKNGTPYSPCQAMSTLIAREYRSAWGRIP